MRYGSIYQGVVIAALAAASSGPMLAEEPKVVVPRYNTMTDAQEVALGAEVAAAIEKENKLAFVDVPVVQSYLTRLVTRLAAQSRRPELHYTVRVVDTADINAFSLPGGYLYVNRGLIEWARNESELAAVVSHEIGHVVGRHSANKFSRVNTVDSLLSEASRVLLGDDTPARIVRQVGGPVAFLALQKYSRTDELQADLLGYYNLQRAGWSAEGMASLFRHLGEQTSTLDSLTSITQSHPPPADREQQITAEMRAFPPKSGLALDSAEFTAVQGQLRKPPKPKTPPVSGWVEVRSKRIGWIADSMQQRVTRGVLLACHLNPARGGIGLSHERCVPRFENRHGLGRSSRSHEHASKLDLRNRCVHVTGRQDLRRECDGLAHERLRMHPVSLRHVDRTQVGEPDRDVLTLSIRIDLAVDRQCPFEGLEGIVESTPLSGQHAKLVIDQPDTSMRARVDRLEHIAGVSEHFLRFVESRQHDQRLRERHSGRSSLGMFFAVPLLENRHRLACKANGIVELAAGVSQVRHVQKVMCNGRVPRTTQLPIPSEDVRVQSLGVIEVTGVLMGGCQLGACERCVGDSPLNTIEPVRGRLKNRDGAFIVPRSGHGHTKRQLGFQRQRVVRAQSRTRLLEAVGRERLRLIEPRLGIAQQRDIDPRLNHARVGWLPPSLPDLQAVTEQRVGPVKLAQRLIG